jgi:hypothetical protein
MCSSADVCVPPGTVRTLARRCIYRYGIVTPARVCARCAESIDETHRMDAIIWKDLRISAFLQNRLIPYFHPTVDRGVDKAYRYVPSQHDT